MRRIQAMVDQSSRLVVWSALIGLLTAGVGLGCGADGASEPPSGNIEGTVSLEGDAEPAGVEVSIVGEGMTDETDEGGTFAFEDLAPDTLTLKFEKQSYVTTTREVDVADDETANVEVTLQQVNEPPRIDGVTVNPQTLEPEGTAEVEVTATDPNPDELSYTYEVSGDFSVDSSEGNKATITAPSEFGAEAALTVRVEDPDGAAASERLDLATADNAPPAINGISASPPTLEPGATSAVTVNASDADGDELSYEWSAPSEWSIDDSSKASIEVTAPDSYGASAVFDVTVSDGRGLSATGTIALSTVANNGPVISSVTAAPQTVARGGDIALNVSATDPNGDDLSYQWSAPMGWSLDDDTLQQPTLTAPDEPGKTASIEVVVTDAEGLEATGSVVVGTLPNQKPVISSVSADSSSLSRGGKTDVTVSADDPNGDTLSYGWSVDNGDWSYTENGDTMTLTAPDKPDSAAKVTVTVSDDVGGEATGSTVVRTVPNERPAINSLYAKDNPVARGGSTDVVVQADDPNGDSLNYSWSIDNGDWSMAENGATLELTAPDKPSSSVRVTVTVTDDLGKSREGTVQVGTVGNDAPRFTSSPPTTDPTAGRGKGYTYQANVTDPDDSSFTWSLSTQPSSSASVDSSGKVTWTPERGAGGTTYTLTLTVSDGYDSVSQTWDLTPDEFSMQMDGSFLYGNTSSADSMRGSAFADFDGDGLTDVGIDPGDSTEHVAYALTSAGFNNDKEDTRSGTGYGDCIVTRAADLEGDGVADVLTACNNDDGGSQNLTLATWTNGINQNDQTGSFSAGSVVNSGVSASVNDLAVADLDGTSGQEAVVADSQQTLHVVANDGSGTLSFDQSVSLSAPASAASGYTIRHITIGEFDGDPEPELLALEGYNDGTNVQAQLAVYEFDGTGTLQTGRASSTILNDNPDKWAVGDLDDDGDLDVAVQTAASPSAIETWLNDGSGSFSAAGSISDSALTNDPGTEAVAIGQIDRDAHADVIVVQDETPYVAFGDGNGTFDEIRALSSASIGQPVDVLHVGDFNGDGLDDLYANDFDLVPEVSVYY